MTVDDRIDEILEITSLVPTPEIKPETSPRIKPNSDSDVKHDDIDYNYYNLIERNQDAVEEMLEIAKQSEHPRAFEVVGQLIKSGLDANKELMSLHKTKKELSIETNSSVNVNNAVFVGSTAELQKLLKAKRG
jgi:predicted house-cleaning noncanonical NTP pyrophosphatase (MazG superfamily)